MRILPGLAALALACGTAYSQAKPGKAHPPKPAPPPRAERRAAAAQPPKKAADHAKQVERLERMSPAERQAMLNRLPPERAKRIQERFDEYEKLPPGERGRLQQQYGQFKQLPAARQEAIRKVFERYNALPQERQQAVRQEFNSLRGGSDDSRRERLNSPEFRNRFNADERKLIEQMATTVPR